jgi:dihydropteroate synthase
MGIVNVTPDSFSGDGLHGDQRKALEQALAFEADGADIIDVGAESTRPGHTPVTAEEELRRLIPVIDLLAAEVKLPISVDTFKAEVAGKALDAGASMLNDVWGLKADPDLGRLAADREVPIVLMHNQKGTEYGDLVPDILHSLKTSVDRATAAGVPGQRIIIDPGIGFGKNPRQNLVVLNRLGELRAMGYPMLVGTSRKSVIGVVLDVPADDRLEGTAATVALSIAGGADIVRVHEVKQMVRVARMSDAIVREQVPEP